MSKEITSLNVEGMSCSHCENAVKKAVGAVSGVIGVTVELKDKKVNVEYDSEKVNLQVIKDVIKDQGYDVR